MRDDEDAPTGNDPGTTPDTSPEVRTHAPRLSLPDYEIGALIGKGGMGEVLLAHDPKIGRDVAIKRMSAASPSEDAVSRFLREAKIQARLQHPAIVPVHELGHDSDGRPYFTMKRLAGTTLLDVLKSPAPNVQRMLRALADVCLAVELAHTEGVVHRDLKPANIMLGDFGEVYVLDWGLARVTGDRESRPSSSTEGLAGDTKAGALLGTPGYMAPEQIHDSSVGPEADVYSLGCILFEILAGESLHPRNAGAMASTLADHDPSPARRRPDRAIAPELDSACIAALAAPAARPTARGLGERIQRYLDGDRDLEQRRAVAAAELANAQAAALDPVRRAEAVRTAGRALALDPDSRAAAALVTQLILEPPREPPPDLARRLHALDHAPSVRTARVGGLVMLVFFAMLPFAMWNGITSWTLTIALSIYFAVCVAYAFYQVYVQRPNTVIALFLGAVLIIGLSRMLGPFIVVPSGIAMMMMALGQQASLIRRPVLVMAVGLTTLVLPVVLEWTGVFGRTFSIAGDRIVISSEMMHLEPIPTLAFLILPNIAIILTTGLFARSLASSRRDALRELETRAWHLQHLLPG